MSPPVITLLTDFGLKDAYAGIVKGVILGICREAQIVDLTHDVVPQDIVGGALVLRSAVAYFPAGTIHVAVVDPGVGSARSPILVQVGEAWLIGPDNGLLHAAAARLGIRRVFVLDRPQYQLPATSHTFHGRDIFAPAAAHLANGVAPESLGTRLEALRPLELPRPAATPDGLAGEVIYADHYGNLVTNITREDLTASGAESPTVSLANGPPIELRSTYADAAPGEAVAVIGSWGHLEIAVRDGNATQRLAAGHGTPVRIRK